MERRYEIDIERRSLAMRTPGIMALNREDALKLLDELHDVTVRLENLRAALRKLAEEA